MNIEVKKTATLTGHTDCLYTLDGYKESNKFFSAGADGMVVLWDLENPENGELYLKVPSSVYAIRCVPEENLLIVGHNHQGIHLVDLTSREEVGSLKFCSSAIFDIHCQKGLLYVATGEGCLYVISLRELKVVKKLQISTQSVRTLLILDDILIAGSSDNQIRVFNISDLSLKTEIPAHNNSVFTLTAVPNKQQFISGSRDAHLKIWNISDFRMEEKIVAHMYAINHIVYRPDAKLFATASLDKTIKIWNAEDNRLLKVVDKGRHGGHSTSVNKLFWSAHQDLLISCSDDRTISVWELKINQ